MGLEKRTNILSLLYWVEYHVDVWSFYMKIILFFRCI